MMVYYSPQASSGKLNYEFNGDVITVTLDGEEDVFDFSGVEVGDEVLEIESDLNNNPIIDAERREDGKLYITVLWFYDGGDDAPESVRFPEWEEVNG